MVINTSIRLSEGTITYDTSSNTRSVNDFLMNEMSLFSVEDTHRSLPSIMDGFKPSQRKILYGFLEDDVYKEIKVATITGKIIEKTHYAHGETSIQGAIICMSQTYIGSGNNLPVLRGIGGFGSRNEGGADAGSARYINAHLEPYTKILFNKDDSKILKRVITEGHKVEPVYYIPIVPLVLLNGPRGIGTGFATNIPPFKLSDILENIRILLKNPNDNLKEMIPYYEGFRGTITKKSTVGNSAINSKWICKGLYERIDSHTFKIKDLPIGLWYKNFNVHANSLIKDDKIEYCNSNDYYDSKTGHQYTEFLVKFNKEKYETVSDEVMEKELKMVDTISGSNFTGFNERGIIQVYEHAQEILYLFYKARLNLYKVRKEHLLKYLKFKVLVISEKARFINMIVDDKLIINKKSKPVIENELMVHSFKKLNVADMIEESGIEGSGSDNCSYDYLLNMHISSLTSEKIEELNKEKIIIENEYNTLYNKTPENMWLEELDQLESSIMEINNKKIEESNNSLADIVAVQKIPKKSKSKKIN